ncbi:hypothetical protein ES703_32303 [subsurface metagenome]
MEYLEQQIKRIKYPHMVREEIELWKRFLAKRGKTFDRYDYDVHVGKGVGKLPWLTEPYSRMAISLSQKRIDVVAHKNNVVYIIELKNVADLQAIGQLEGYKTLYQDKYINSVIGGCIIVCSEADQDVERAASKRNIVIMLV